MQYVPPNPDFNPCTEPISILLSYDPNIGVIGTCTITITTTVNLSGYSSWPYCWSGQSSFTFTDTFTHYYGPYPPDPPVSVDCSDSLYPIAETAAINFPSYYNSLGLGSSVNHVDVAIDSDSSVYAGVLSGQYDVGLVDRLPNSGEYNSNTQLYAIGYNGNVTYDVAHGLFDSSKIVWMVTDGNIMQETPQMATGVFVSYSEQTWLLCFPWATRPLIQRIARAVSFHLLIRRPRTANLISQTSNISSLTISDIIPKASKDPFCDLNADGKINFGDIQLFVHHYLQYYQLGQVYTSTDAINGLNSGLLGSGDGSNAVANLDGPAVLPPVAAVLTLLCMLITLLTYGLGVLVCSGNPSVLNLTNINEGRFLAWRVNDVPKLDGRLLDRV